MKVGVLTVWNQAMNALGDIAGPNREAYCRRHGYDCLNLVVADRPGWKSNWLPRFAVLDVLAGYDWLLSIDADAVILDQARPLDDLLMTQADLVASYDVNGLNIGVMFWRNSPWTFAYLKKVFAAGPRYHLHPSPDQSTMAHLLLAEPKDRWEVVPQRRFNSYLYGLYPDYPDGFPEGEYQPGDFILHLPSLPIPTRLAVLTRYLQDFSSPPS